MGAGGGAAWLLLVDDDYLGGMPWQLDVIGEPVTEVTLTLAVAMLARQFRLDSAFVVEHRTATSIDSGFNWPGLGAGTTKQPPEQ